MSCQNFVANTWRKEICSNCFGHREEHYRSQKLHTSSYGKMSQGHQGQGQGLNIPRISSTTTSTTRNNNNPLPIPNTMSVSIMSQSSKSQSQHENLFISRQSSSSSSVSSVSASGLGVNLLNNYANKRLSAGAGNNMDKDKVDCSRRVPQFNVGGPMRPSPQDKSGKGILKTNKANKPRKMSVTFPQEVVSVIGYGSTPRRCDMSSDSEDDGPSTPSDPLDSISISELLEKNATTMDEKEFYRLTQKNTNFNSIKTNLLGKTNIELGPIVGGKGGKNKPLISIGTFETRNEPLRITKKIAEDDPDEWENKHRKFVSTTPTTTPTPTITKPQAQVMMVTPRTVVSTPSKQSPTIPVVTSAVASTPMPSKQSPVVPVAPSIVVASKTTNKAPFTSTTSAIDAKTPAKVPIVTTNFNAISKTVPAPSVNKPVINAKPLVTISSAKESSESKNELSNGLEAKPKKSILKNSHGSSGHCTSSSDDEKIPPPIPTSKVPINDPLKSNALTNLIILTEGNKIASKRTSFLCDIMDDKKPTAGAAGERSAIAKGQSTNDNLGIISTSTTTSSSIESQPSSKDSLEQEETSRTDLKTSNKIKSPFAKIELGTPLAIKSTPTGQNSDSEFDDSLEDSGLDIAKTPKSDESDEKSGSSSDSGNENDYIKSVHPPRLLKKAPNAPPVSKPSLYISVDEEEHQSDGCESQKLSPDSVIFSSASEMSASGSNESIPESLEHVEVETTRKDSTSTISSLSSKRPAPLPPQNDVTSVVEELYANAIKGDSNEEESNYDDVSTLKGSTSRTSLFDDFDDNEMIYDDITSSSSTSHNTKMAQGSKMGSYNFGDTTTGNGEHDELEPVITSGSDGIEFIGIRKIDAESFLRERSSSPRNSRFLPSSPTSTSTSRGGSLARSSSQSPKARRKVNQFFSTIGKKAGAAFNQANAHFGKSTPSPTPTATNYNNYKRSMSTDSVASIRTQEIYATVTPTSMKFKGFAPVLSKLSKIDFHNDRNSKFDDELDPKGQKKNNKISSSIKKFLRFGNKESSSPDQLQISAPYHDKPSLTSSEEYSITSSLATGSDSGTPVPSEVKAVETNNLNSRPPPPPPRVHSLDLLTKVGVIPGGTVKPARPPPPVRSNRIAPSFTQVFDNPGTTTPSPDKDNTLISSIPPCKPRRKNSVNHRDLETSYNHITNLNLETLKLIANQPLTKIRTSSSLTSNSNGSSSFSWSQFDMATGLRPEPLFSGNGFAFYSAGFEGSNVILLIQETASAPAFAAPIQFPCVETLATFQDNVPPEFISWKPSDYVRMSNGHIKGTISVLPPCVIRSLPHFIKSSSTPLKDKYLALLLSLDSSFWSKCESLEDLLVFKQSNNNSLPSTLIYVESSPTRFVSSSSNQQRRQSNSNSESTFENGMKQLLLTSSEEDDDDESPVLSSGDKSILLQRLSGSSSEVRGQLKLFFQLKLFAPSKESADYLRIVKYKNEHSIQQWLDRERAMVMKEAVERLTSGNGLSTSTSCSMASESISPFKKAYLEFLMEVESAKGILDMFVELLCQT